MSDVETLLIAVGVVVVVLATASAWMESRVEHGEEPAHRKILRKDRRYREHLSRRK